MQLAHSTGEVRIGVEYCAGVVPAISMRYGFAGRLVPAGPDLHTWCSGLQQRLGCQGVQDYTQGQPAAGGPWDCKCPSCISSMRCAHAATSTRLLHKVMCQPLLCL